MGTLEGTAVALVMERGNAAVWAIHWDGKLLAAVYSVRILNHLRVKLNQSANNIALYSHIFCAGNILFRTSLLHSRSSNETQGPCVCDSF